MNRSTIAGALAAAVTLLLVAAAAPAEKTPVTEPFNGPVIADPDKHVLTGATVHPAPGQRLDNATVIIDNGRIVAVKRGQPSDADRAGAQVHDYTGHHLYAGFIDPWVGVDAPMPHSDAPGAHWCNRVTPQRHALAGEGLNDSLAESLRKLGFAAAAIAPTDGVFRGQAAVVSTASDPTSEGLNEPPVYVRDAFHALGFDRSGWVEATYPTSVPGVVALMRQSLSDADWQRAQRANKTNLSPNAIDALEDPDHLLVFDTTHELMAFLAEDVSTEFGRPFAVVGAGSEFRVLPALADLNQADNFAGFILPLRFPAKPDVTTAGKADSVDLRELMRWEQAPTNPRRLIAQGHPVALTTSKVTKRNKFHAHLAHAVKHGLSEADALASVTTTPADMLGLADRLGSIEPGKIASLVISKAPLGDKAFEPIDLWIDGRRHRINDPEDHSFDGTWSITTDDGFEMDLIVKGEKFTKRVGDQESATRNAAIDGASLSWIDDDDSGNTGAYIMSGTRTADTIRGVGVAPNQSTFQWTATRSAPAEQNDEEESKADDTPDVPESFGFPFGPYARTALPPQETLAVTGATIWTSGPDGVIENGLLIINNGKVAHVGRALDPAAPSIPNNARVIDAAGKHITPGLIDAHSHTGLFRFGVNESGQAVTSEVRIADSMDPAHINWYRQLAGGVTSVNSLHGSANPIGGQNVISKVRWGSVSPKQMLFQGAPLGIKFALGENVKQSNWGDDKTTRYPQTRMGVETIMRDRFHAAEKYFKEWSDLLDGFDLIDDGVARTYAIDELDDIQWDFLQQALLRARGEGVPRRDLELEALVEVLAGRRLIHCHSYRQDEILMLCRIAEDFGFKIGTFQHGLEVYKVAEAVRENAIGASLFSDWWAFKVEVQDAIPYAGPLQSNAGVLTSYNSDDDGLARRMNSEAAKAHKYGATAGGLDPAEALKFVTINPAIQLGIADRVGSLEPGKDADFAIWSADPLSAFARCEATYIDGCEYFSLAQDRLDREAIAQERSRIIQKLIANDDKSDDQEDDDEIEGEKADLVDPGQGLHRFARAGLREYFLDQLRQGNDPTLPTCGDCGCGVIHLGAILSGR
ncbi:MAG: amidohydrolase family protein [Planctomycetota bacterium]